MVARPPRPWFHASEVLPEFVVWSEDPAGSWLQLPRFFANKPPAAGPGELWLQVDGCCSRASWVVVEVVAVKTGASRVGVPNCASKADGNRRRGTQCLPRFGPSRWR